MKILFTSDLHGEEALYRQIREAARDSGAEVLILGATSYLLCRKPAAMKR